MNPAYQQALTLLNGGHCEEARRLYSELLRGHDEVKFILNDLGVTHFLQEDAGRALSYYDAALLIDPQFAIAHQNRGNALMKQDRVDEAIASFYASMECSNDKGWVIQVGHQILTRLSELDRKEDINAYWRVLIERFPNDAGILHNYANHLSEAFYRYDEALEIYQRLESHPDVDLPQLYNDWGVALKGAGRTVQAREMYRRALAIRPFMPVMYSTLLFDSLYDPDLAPDMILELHKGYEKNQVPQDITPFSHNHAGGDPDRPLRIGYLSSDFRHHSIGLFTLSVIKNHDPHQFEVFCYYNCPVNDDYTDEFKSYARLWRVVDGMDPGSIARLIHDDRIDILVELNGHTKGNVLPVLFYKPAPVQMTWLGNVHSLGISTVDWFITDAIADPPGMTEGQFVEKLLRLPGSFLCFTPYKETPDLLDTPALVNGFVTFGLVGNFAKINQYMVGLYARVMHALPGSMCLVRSSGVTEAVCRAGLTEMFSREGIDADRLILRPRTDDIQDYLATFREIDILFDFYPFNGETITCAALQMGTPMVSLAGTSHRSRAGLSILTALGHPEWASDSADGFIEAAASLAKDAKRLNDIHHSLKDEFLSSPLCNGSSFTGQLEGAYKMVWEEYMKR